MNLPMTFRIAYKALGRNKMRSGLTMLGIIIGVGAVIAMIAIGSGAKARIQEQIASMGSNLIIVLSGSATSGGMRFGSGSVPTLTVEDSKAIAAECSAVKYSAPVLQGVTQVVYGNQNWSTVTYASTPEALLIRDWPVVRGRTVIQSDVEGAAKVCLLGQTVVENLFGDIDPVGQVVRIKQFPFTVIGVLSLKGQTTWGQDQDDVVYVPLTTGQRLLFGQQFPGMVRAISVQATGPDTMKQAEDEITQLLRQRHRIRPNQENDFSVRNLTETYVCGRGICQGDVSSPGSHRLHFPAGRRHWHHEYHACVRDRAHPGDRHPHGRGRARTGHPLPVSHRSPGPEPDRRGDRHLPGGGRFPAGRPSFQMANPHLLPGFASLLLLCGRRRRLLRLLPGAQGRQFRPD